MVRTRESTRTEYRMERLEGNKWVEVPLGIKLTLEAQKQRLAVWSRENPGETYRLTSRTVSVTSWVEVEL